MTPHQTRIIQVLKDEGFVPDEYTEYNLFSSMNDQKPEILVSNGIIAFKLILTAAHTYAVHNHLYLSSDRISRIVTAISD